MSAQTRPAANDRNNPDIEKGNPLRQDPDKLPDEDTTGPVESKRYGKSSALNVDAEETEGEEYHAEGMPKTSAYTVDKKAKSDPRVSTPKEKQGQSDRNDKADYGF